MNNNYKNNADDIKDPLDYTFTSLDLNEDLSKMYEIINNKKLKQSFESEKQLAKLRNENYKRYNNIDIVKYKNLPHEFNDVKAEIVKLYECIDVKEILNDDYENSMNIKTILNNIYYKISRLDSMVKTYLKEIVKYNNEKQKQFSRAYFNSLDVSDKLKKDLIEKYNDLVLLSSNLSNDIYRELRIQCDRKNIIDEILKMLNLGMQERTNSITQDRLKPINLVINQEIEKYKDKIQYLEDLIIKDSKYSDDFNQFISFFNKIIAYDDTNYENARQTFDILVNDKELKNNISKFEELFINEKEEKLKEEKFIYEKIGLKNITKSLEYIKKHYYNNLSIDLKQNIDYIERMISQEECDITRLVSDFKLIVNYIWQDEITDIYKYNRNERYCFICTNNQFIDEKYQTILITNDEIKLVNDYEDYQIGFICGYNDNIMYITENDDIMTVSGNDMSNLKTPYQLEQEFVNFKVCNRIALNGYKTKVIAVYFINDGNMDKYVKAVELANMYNLPLIEFKK